MMLRYLPLREAQRQIQSGWIGFPRSTGYVSRLIRRATGGEYSHVFMFGRVGKITQEVHIFEVREFLGGRIMPLAEYRLLTAAEIDVFRIDLRFAKDFDGEGAIREAREMISRTRYNWWQILRIALRRTPFLWHLFPTSFDEGADIGNVYSHCSHGVDYWCHRGGGIKSVKRLASHFVTPTDIARSLLFDYAFTIQ